MRIVFSNENFLYLIENMKLRICSFNIRFKNSMDGLNSWENRLTEIEKFTKKNQFSIIGTQEGRFDQLKEFEKITGLKLIDSHRPWINERMYPCFFVDIKKIKILKSGDIWLSLTPEIPGSSSFQSSFPRLATWIKFVIIELGIEMYAFNVHLDHILESTRLEQIKVLIQSIFKINKEHIPLILLGDFNESPLSNTYLQIITELGLLDCWALCKKSEESSHHGFKGINPSGSRIDWMFITDHLSCDDIELDKSESNGVYLSDHFPLVATLKPKCK